MRLALTAFIALPSLAMADTFTVPSAPSTATIYANAGAAVVERDITLTLPAGQHEVILPDLPLGVQPQYLRVGATGAALQSTEFRDRAVPPQPDADDPAITAAEDRINAAEAALRDHDNRIAQIRAGKDAALAQIAFLNDLGQNQNLTIDITQLRALSEMIRDETRTAQEAALDVELEALKADEARRTLEEELANAKAALDALTPRPKENAQLTLALDAAQAGDVTLSLSYLVQANWSPVYDVYLSGTDSPTIDLRRGALVSQSSGENWEGVTLHLSTLELTGQLAPQDVREIRRTLIDKEQVQYKATSRMVQADSSALADPVIEAPVIMEESAAMVSFDGPGVTYTAPLPVNVASGVDSARIALDALQFDARRFARAAPRYDTTAFLMAEITNTTQEPLLGSFSAAYYLDNTLIGEGQFPTIPAGDQTDLAFGPIEALRLTYTVLDENEGDRGIIRRSNEKTERVRMEVENIGSEDWNIELRAAVPYAVQEDLEITWSATPKPSTENIEDRRGVLEWVLDVPAGQKSSVLVETALKWPEDKLLR